jgi:hypothetical protein
LSSRADAASWSRASYRSFSAAPAAAGSSGRSRSGAVRAALR